MEIILQIDEPFQTQVESEPIARALQLTLNFFKQTSGSGLVAAGSVTIVVTDNDTIQELNAQYRGIAAPTDVLSFENSPDPDFPELDEVDRGHLGDVIIAFPVAQAQALAAGHTPQNEVVLLAVHGLLHLLGFDHDTPENKEKMWSTQRQVMAELGLAHVQATES